MTTYSAKPTDVTRKWYLVDAMELPLGRLATVISTLLLGKGKPQFTKHIDCGDYVIVINAAKLVYTGSKDTKKKYYRHSGYPGGLTETSLSSMLESHPERIIEQAVKGMLPTNKLRDGRLARLKIYAGSEHQHEAQKPETLALKEGK